MKMENLPEESNTPATLINKIDNIDIERFESLVYTRQLDRAGAELLDVLNKLRSGAEFIGHAQADPRAKLVLYSRLAAAIAHLVADPAFNLSQEGFEMLGVQHAATSAVFENSIFDTADMAIPGLISNPTERDPKKFEFSSPECMAKFLLLYSLHSRIEMNFEVLCEQAANTVLPVFLGMLTNYVVLTPMGCAQRDRLLGMGKYFDGMLINETMLPAISDAFMYASYGTRPDRHEVKRHFSKMLRGIIKARNIELPKFPKKLSKLKDKPTILIAIEWMSSFHAMYRCYAPSIMQLREKFHLVGCVRENDLDPVAMELFDEILPLPAGDVILDGVIAKIKKLAPDIIYYPSVGMALWWVALSSVRLAPIQVMTLGHPATTHSEAMDYVITEDGTYGDESLSSERIIWMPEGSLQHVERADSGDIQPAPIREMPDSIRVAVPAMIAKLSAPFLDCLQRIKQAARRNVTYVFLPNTIGMWHWIARKRLVEWFPDCEVHGRSGYQEYLGVLQSCDLQFNPFPFGNTNGNIDAFLAGLPVLTKYGHEPHEAYDSLMLHRIDMDGMIAQTIEQYESLGTMLIENDALRIHFAEHLRKQDIRGEFFGERQGPANGAFARAMWHIYRNHNAIQKTACSVPWTDYTDVYPAGEVVAFDAERGEMVIDVKFPDDTQEES